MAETTVAPAISNPVYRELVELGVIDPATVRRIGDRTRDLPVPVYLDETSKVIFLESCETTDDYYAVEKAEDRDERRSVTHLSDGSVLKTVTLEDDRRRFAQFRDRLAGKSICDFGCSYGGFLELAAGTASAVHGVELRDHCRARIAAEAPAIEVETDIRDHRAAFDVVTMFHVLEHIPEQVAMLQRIRECMAPGGTLIVEVPHARDFLIQSVDLPAFRDFTFWSEHLVLHTDDSLQRVIAAAGFENVTVEGYQRYGYTNHLRWFIEGKPGGHDAYRQFDDPALDAAYRDYIAHRGATDTLIAVARRPAA